jgi:hypothetical protein
MVVMDPKTGNNVVLLNNVHRTPARITFGPMLMALKLGYKTARTPWIHQGRYLKIVGETIMEVIGGLEEMWVPAGQFDILAEDWVILAE